MPDQEGATGPEGAFFYGNSNQDVTPWICEWVRVELAEHHSTIYDTVPKGAIPVIVQMVLAAMAAAEAEPDEPEEPEEGGDSSAVQE